MVFTREKTGIGAVLFKEGNDLYESSFFVCLTILMTVQLETLVGTFISPEYGAEQNGADISTTGIYRVDQLGVFVCFDS